MSSKVNASVRLEQDVIDRLDALAVVLAPPCSPRRTDALLATLHVGLQAFEDDPTMVEAAKRGRSGST